MSLLYFDVETIPDWEREPRFELTPPEDCEDAGDWLERVMSTSPEYCLMVGLNWGIDNEEPESVWVGETIGDKLITEILLLKKFWQLAKASDTLIGFNCIGFDLNVLLVRSALLGVRCPFKLWDEKPWDNHVVDLMVRRFKNVGWRERRGLKQLRRSLFDTTQPPYEAYKGFLANDGADVAQIYQCFAKGDEKALKVLKGYGKLDIVTTRHIAQLWEGYYWS